MHVEVVLAALVLVVAVLVAADFFRRRRSTAHLHPSRFPGPPYRRRHMVRQFAAFSSMMAAETAHPHRQNQSITRAAILSLVLLSIDWRQEWYRSIKTAG